MFNDNIMYDPEKCSLTKGIELAKELIGIKNPYYIDRRIDGEQVIFSDHFLDAFRKALSFNCIADMTDKEKDLYFDYIEWTKDKENYDISDINDDEMVFEALDEWATDELLGNPHPEQSACQ